MSRDKTEVQADSTLTVGKRRGGRKVLVLAAVFVLGVLLGAAMTVVVGVQCVQSAMKHPAKIPSRIARRLDRRLDLTAEQRAQVEAILAEGQMSLRAIRADVKPRIKTELNHIADEISAVLTEEQRQEWEPLYERIQLRWMPAFQKSDE